MSVLHGLLAPPPFLSDPGEPNIPWKLWVRMFINYAIASSSSLSEERKIAMLTNCLGCEGQRIFYSIRFPEDKDEKKYADIVSVCESLFSKRENPLIFRYEMFLREQGPDESVAQFVTALRQIASKCQYSSVAVENETIRDQLVFKCKSKRVREALLKTEDLSKLTLDEAISTAKRMEALQMDLQTLETSPSVSVTNAVSAAPISRRDIPQRRQEQPISAPVRVRPGRHCFRCGSLRHLANDLSCPAKNISCNKCGKMGHFRSVCNSSAGVLPNRSSVNALSLEEGRESNYGATSALGLEQQVQTVTLSSSPSGVFRFCASGQPGE